MNPRAGMLQGCLLSSGALLHHCDPDLGEITPGLCIQEEGSGLSRQAQTLRSAQLKVFANLSGNVISPWFYSLLRVF